MRSLLWVVLVIDCIHLLMVGSMDLLQFEKTDFAQRTELEKMDVTKAKYYRKLYKLLPQVRMLQSTELVILLIIAITLLTHLNRPIVGMIYAVVGYFIFAFLSRRRLVKHLSQAVFNKYLPLIISVTEFLQPLWKIIGIPKRREQQFVHSLAEFTDQLRRLPSTVLSPAQRQRLESVLESENKTVKDIMTPKKRIVMVEPSATLGPILLSDLQKSGHGYFPVATKKGEPEGILKLSDIDDIQTAKQRSLVREQMSGHISWVEEETSLYELAKEILQHKQYLILVRGEEQQLTGIVTIADLMKHLVGVVEGEA